MWAPPLVSRVVAVIPFIAPATTSARSAMSVRLWAISCVVAELP